MTILKIYTDGACSGNQNEKNFGGWGAVLRFGEHSKELYGSEANTTNNRMELTAVLEAFRALKKTAGNEIQLFSDSSYFINAMRQGWIDKWMKNGWKTSGKEPVKNIELWQAIIPFIDANNVQFFHVKGHVSLSSSESKLQQIWRKFNQSNKSSFSYEEFLFITEMNNRCDELANKGVDEIRGQ